MRLTNYINALARKILGYWVRTEVLPTDLSRLQIQPNTQIIYVVEDRSWSRLLVLETTCEQLGLPAPLDKIDIDGLRGFSCVYTVNHRQSFSDWLKQGTKQPKMLKEISKALKQHPEKDIQFIPVSLFWGRPVSVKRGWISILLADGWVVTGSIRKFLTIVRHGRNTFIQFSEALSFRENQLDLATPEEVSAHLQASLANKLLAVRTAMLGPNMSHRATLVHDIIKKEDVQTAIKKKSSRDKITYEKASLLAKQDLTEIVANCSNTTILLLQKLLPQFWNRFYSGIKVSHTEPLAELAQTHQLVYVPCHRSHVDYLLLSYIIYYEGLAIPYIAAGKNLNIPIIGRILRGAGAFFIRRTFKNNPLYSSVLFEYMATLISKGVAIEYFVEGGRSRTGRLLKPKPGMLSMTVRAFLKYQKRPVVFIPVYIGYEKMIESKSYQDELAGKRKKSETLLGSLKSISKIRGQYGQVYVNFAKPIFLSTILDKNIDSSYKTTPYDDNERPDGLRQVIQDLSNTIAVNINDAAAVTNISLIATIMLTSNKQSIDEVRLIEAIDKILGIIASGSKDKATTITQSTAQEQIKHAEKLQLLYRHKHDLGDILYLDKALSVSLTYYRNNIIHLLALPSLIACCFINTRRLEKQELIELVSLVYPFLKEELFLPWDASEIEQVIEEQIEVLIEQELLSKHADSDTYSRPSTHCQEFSQICLLAKIISPILEVYYLSLAVVSIETRKEQETTRSQLQKRIHLIAQRISMIYEFNSPDYSDKNLIVGFIDALISLDYITANGAQVAYKSHFEHSNRRIRLLLGREKRNNILQIVKQAENTIDANQ